MTTAVYIGEDDWGCETFKAGNNYYCFLELDVLDLPVSERIAVIKKAIGNYNLGIFDLGELYYKGKEWDGEPVSPVSGIKLAFSSEDIKD